MISSLKDLLPDALRRGHISEQVAVARAIGGANRAIVAALPPGHAGDAQAVYLREGIIAVACLNAPAMQRISRLEAEIVAAALREAPKAVIRGIRVRLVQRISGTGDMLE